MKSLRCALMAFLFVSCGNGPIDEPQPALVPVTFEKVTLEDDFWLPRLKTQKEVLVPFALQKTEPVVDNLRKVGEWNNDGRHQTLSQLPRYVASDLFKIIEGAAYLLSLERDSHLEEQIDQIIEVISEAQLPDGYLYEPHSVLPDMYKLGWGTGEKPYSFVVHSHELYNMGHMYEAAIAYWRATGKRAFLDVAEKNARHINRVFFEGDPSYNDGVPVNQAPGHQEIELALVKLYQATGDTLYLDMARKFIDVRGVSYIPDGTGVMSATYSQQHLPVREQKEAVGHSVRALYMYSAMADVMGQSGDETLAPALDAIWHDIADTKIHITGGLGSVPGIEGFGPAYELPNRDTYDETCAAVANVFFNYRMFLATRDARYVDMAETSLYNNVLAGVNLEGNRFFYVNVLQADGKKAFNHGRAGRSPWFSTACCPSNMARLIPQVPGMMYSYTGNDVYCGLYAGSRVSMPLECGEVTLKQRTDYPFGGNVSFDVNPSVDGAEFTLWLRVPTWCTDRFMPGELYRYCDRASCKVQVKVNGKKVSAKIVDGFLPVCRSWHPDDKVELEMTMPVRLNVADQRVEADRGCVCLTKGPLVYCAEQPDNEYPAFRYVVSSRNIQCEEGEFENGPLDGIANFRIDASAVDCNGEEIPASLTLIPYYAWNNRGDNVTMNVWFARSADIVDKNTTQMVGDVKSVDASHTNGSDDVEAIADGKLPSGSFDISIPRWTSWPQRGQEQQVTIVLNKPRLIQSVSVYWYDDEGGVQTPMSWNAEYRHEGQWREFKPYTTDVFGVAKDQFNMVHPDADIKADALRLNIQPKPDAAAGILEVMIE